MVNSKLLLMSRYTTVIHIFHILFLNLLQKRKRLTLILNTRLYRNVIGYVDIFFFNYITIDVASFE